LIYLSRNDKSSEFAQLKRNVILSENPGFSWSDQSHTFVFYMQHGSFPQTHNPNPRIGCYEFLDPLLACFSGMSFGVCIKNNADLSET
jgi:hypothetical protein